MLLTALLVISLIWFSVEDIRNRRLTLNYIMGFAGIGLALQIYYRNISAMSLIGGIAIGGVVLMLSIATQGKIGLGDAAILGVTGVYLGFQRNMELIILAFFLAGLWSLVLLARKKNRHYEMPFVPFLLISLLLMEGYGFAF